MSSSQSCWTQGDLNCFHPSAVVSISTFTWLAQVSSGQFLAQRRVLGPKVIKPISPQTLMFTSREYQSRVSHFAASITLPPSNCLFSHISIKSCAHMCTDILDNNCVRIIYLQNDLRVQCRNQHAHFPAIQSKTIPSCKSQVSRDMHIEHFYFMFYLFVRFDQFVLLVSFIYSVSFVCVSVFFLSVLCFCVSFVGWSVGQQTQTHMAHS